MMEMSFKLFYLLLASQQMSAYAMKLILEHPEESGLYEEGDLKGGVRNGISSNKAKWPRGIIPYSLEGSFTEHDQNILMKAVDEFHNKTCVRFRKRYTERNYVAITSADTGCWSSVGRLGGRQEVNLEASKCFSMYGTVLHELMHVLGFYHEQNRFERDDFVKVLKENIITNRLNNFDKLPYNAASSYGVDYDYASVMHYRATSFSKNGKSTLKAIKATSEAARMGQREGFSPSDLKKINVMYKC